MKSSFLILAFTISFWGFCHAQPRETLKVNFENSAEYRWLNKKVLDNRMLDDMENISTWEGFTIGADEIVDARKVFKRKDATNIAAISHTSPRLR